MAIQNLNIAAKLGHVKSKHIIDRNKKNAKAL